MSTERGGALLAVLWLSMGLSAIVFTVATTVRGETERTATSLEDVRSYYLAAGALERAILYMQWGPQHTNPDGTPRFYAQGTPRLYYQFPSGVAEVEIVPESAKLNINRATDEELMRLLIALGVPPDRAQVITAGIVDWRSPQAAAGPSEFDVFYLAQSPSFQGRHTSFEETEELLLIRGMTPEIYYGTYTRDASGRMVPLGGLRDCVTVWGSGPGMDVNTAHPAALAAVGVPPQTIAAIVERRRVAPFRADEMPALVQAAGPAGSRLGRGGNSIFTLRATAQLRLDGGKLSDLRRSAGVMVKFMPSGYDKAIHIMRWYENASKN
jgi:general secretion pathway protein K